MKSKAQLRLHQPAKMLTKTGLRLHCESESISEHKQMGCNGQNPVILLESEVKASRRLIRNITATNKTSNYVI